MLTKDIKYKLSTDYDRLQKLLKKGCKVIGFSYMYLNKKHHKEYSKLHTLEYIESETNLTRYELDTTVFADDMDEIGFLKYCEHSGIRFIDLEEINV